MSPSHHPPAAVRVVGLATAALLLAAACTTGAATTTPSAAPSAAAPSTAASASAAASSGASGATADVVKTAQDAKAGAYLTGKDGKSLYVNTKEAGGTLACTSGQCVGNWPPFTVGTGGTVTAGSGVNGTFATVARPDGSTQVTYNGAPLYYFAGDKAAGDTKGQGLSNVWFLASPAGGPAGQPAASAPASSPSPKGYSY